MIKTVFIDSNYLIRAVSSDDKKQLEVARDLLKKIEENKLIGQISILVLSEVLWVLERHYNMERKLLIPPILEIVAMPGIKILEVKKIIIIQVLEKMLESKIDLTDLYLLMVAKKNQIATFDKELLKVNQVS